MAEQRVILITGSSRGIGAGLAEHFAGKGLKVVINHSKSDEEAGRLHRRIAGTVDPGSVMLVKADVSKRADVRSMFDRIVASYGSVDVLVNNAGINLDRPFLEMTDEQWQRVIDTNLTGTFICSQEFALRFKGKIGHIINIGATTGIRGRKNGCNYCSSKAGVINLTKCLALELAPRILVNCVVPGFIETEEVMTRYNLYNKENYDTAVSETPMGRLGTTRDISVMVDFIVSGSEYVTGQSFFVNGGYFLY